MSKMKELDNIATNVADVMRELLDKNAEWGEGTKMEESTKKIIAKKLVK